MADITIDYLEDDLMDLLREQAERHGRGVEEEARHILECALAGELKAGASDASDHSTAV